MKATSFYFYDLETSSGSPRNGRIMQFAGIRTDLELNPIGESDNLLVKLADDVIPEPDAILVHGITPQKTLEEGLTEAEFVKYFQDKVSLEGTIFVGFNNIRFDDEFMRRICYRTFFDPYQWHWKDGRSRWDLMDPLRMMRALRPEGLKWPMLNGKPTVKLELMGKENGLNHTKAHDALSDVEVLVELTQKFRSAQPKLFDYLLQTRDKKKVAELVLSGEEYVYTSGKYSSEFEKTTVVQTLIKHPRRDSAIVYDLRHDPTRWMTKSVTELVEHWQVRYGDEKEPLPVKVLHFNHCPAIAPISVLDEESKKRIKIDMEAVANNHKILSENPEFKEKIADALDEIENKRQTSLDLETNVDEQMYEGFWVDADQSELEKIRLTKPEELDSLRSDVKNKRIRDLIPPYIARNYPKFMTPEEVELWEDHKRKVFYSGKDSSVFAKFSKRMADLKKERTDKNSEYLLTELRLYVESILPEVE